ncbi:mannose-6-phosphate isomerase, class I [Aeromicrobium sp. CTD01-1L150]|uniref:mannose-6-phosphate isomerase, class I n=1 Tax=Aeromicrobium sp. CTD01-1L150 TaxID=3341830 RepID=UPI0035BF3C5B
MRRLQSPRRTYDWGSREEIPDFLGQPVDGERVAEVWLGTHALAPSLVDGPDGPRSLLEVSGELPFMLKILAADRPLSLQVHPDAELARAGFDAEEASGTPLDAPHRVFKDPHPKPEMVLALTTFDTLVGFRPTAEILRVLGALPTSLTQKLAERLRAEPGFAGIVALVEQLVTDPPTPQEVGDVVAACADGVQRRTDVKRAYLTALEVNEHHAGDVGVVISLLLNRLTLQPGEAAYLATGIIHAHLKGMCLEVMVSSDNVLRAGLTSKHLDPQGLVRCVSGGMSRLARVEPEQFGESTDVFSPGLREFALSMTQVSPAEPAGTPLPDQGRRIIVCTGGEVELVNEHDERLPLRRGSAVYADAADGTIRAHGTGEVGQAYTPTAEDRATPLTDLV